MPQRQLPRGRGRGDSARAGARNRPGGGCLSVPALLRDEVTDPYPRWREIMRDATRRGKLTREKIAELLADDTEEFIRWATGDDEELGQMVEVLREERRAGRLF